MAHSCPNCGQACYCDGDDTWIEDVENDIPDECLHVCEEIGEGEEFSWVEMKP